MSKPTVQIRGDALEATLRGFDIDRRNKALFKAVEAGAKELQALTVAQLKADMGDSATRRGLKGRPKYADHSPMTEGVRLMRNKWYVESGVHIMGDFRLKWFERGTTERFTGGRKDKFGFYPGGMNASGYRGRIQGKGFFGKARTHEAQIAGAIEDKLGKELSRLLKQ